MRIESWELRSKCWELRMGNVKCQQTLNQAGCAFLWLMVNLLDLKIKVWTVKKICLLWTNLSGRYGFSPVNKILHKDFLVYDFRLFSSNPSSLLNICTLRFAKAVQSNKKCSHDSVWKLHCWQDLVCDWPISYIWEFRNDLPTLSWVCKLFWYLNPQLKCLNFWGFSFSFNLIKLK